MEIKKVVSLGQSEIELLVSAGKVLREISTGLESGTIDEINLETANLLAALKEVLSTIIPQ